MRLVCVANIVCLSVIVSEVQDGGSQEDEEQRAFAKRKILGNIKFTGQHSVHDTSTHTHSSTLAHSSTLIHSSTHTLTHSLTHLSIHPLGELYKLAMLHESIVHQCIKEVRQKSPQYLVPNTNPSSAVGEEAQYQ